MSLGQGQSTKTDIDCTTLSIAIKGKERRLWLEINRIVINEYL